MGAGRTLGYGDRLPILSERSRPVRIEIFGARNAPQLEQTQQLVEEAVAEAGGAGAEVVVVPVEGPEDSRAKKSFGTPTVRVNGLDVEYAEREPEEYSAGGRYYATP